MAAIKNAAKSGAAMNELLAKLPYSEQMNIMRNFRNSNLAGASVNALTNTRKPERQLVIPITGYAGQ